MKIERYFLKHNLWKSFLILAVIGLLVYANAVHHPFVHDDVFFIEHNPFIADLNIPDIFSQTYGANTESSVVNTYYRPLLELYNRIVFRFFGKNPHAFHLINVLLHIFNGFLVYLLIYGICVKNRIFLNKKNTFALSVAVLFLIHPVQSEAVACISGISNLLVFFFSVLSLYFYIQAFSYVSDVKKSIGSSQGQETSGSPSAADIPQKDVPRAYKRNAVMFLSKAQILSSPLLARHLKDPLNRQEQTGAFFIKKFDFKFYCFSLVAFFFALASKELAIVVPFLVILYDLCFSLRKRDVFKQWKPLGGYVLIFLGYLGARKLLFGHAITSSTIFNQEFLLRVMSVPRTLWMYFSILIIPKGLHYYRCTSMVGPVIFPLVGVLCVLGLLVYFILRLPSAAKRMNFFGLGFFFITLSPTLNIVPLVNEYSLLLTSEHFLYLPMVGFSLLFFSLLAILFDSQKWGRLRFILFVLLISALSFLTVRQNTFWRGEIPLFRQTLKYQKDFARVRILLGKAYYNHEEYQNAIDEFNKALEIMQGYVGKVTDPQIRMFYLNYMSEIYQYLAHCYEQLSLYDNADAYYKQSLDLFPDNSVVYHNRGINALKEGNTLKAINFLKEALKIDPKNLMAANSLAIVYEEAGEMDKAEKFLRFIVEQDPSSESARKNLEKLLLKKAKEK